MTNYVYSANFAVLKKLKKPKAVIFDWDNTLVDTWPLIQTAIDTTMVQMGREPWGLKKVQDNIHKSMRESFPEIFGDKWQAAGEIYKNTYRSMNLSKLRLLPAALDLINKLEEKNILQFVVSNKIGVTLRKEALALEVDKKFFALVGSMDANDDKPSKDPVDLALLGSDLDPKKDEIWFVGDTVADIACAYNAGCTPIIYGHQNAASKTIPPEWVKNGQKQEGPIALYLDHQELIDVIEGF